jgi:putative acetyltransferase
MIRPYSRADLELVVALFGRSVREIASRDYDVQQISAWAPEKPDLEAWAARLAAGVVLVAEDQGELAGVIKVDEDGHIDLLYVHPRYQRRGIASSLLREVRRIATVREWPRLFCEASITARPFFERRGFRVLAAHSTERGGVFLANYRMEQS